MRQFEYPPRETWNSLLQRPYIDNREVVEAVRTILHGVRQHGDEALVSFTKKFDGYEGPLEVEEAEKKAAGGLLPEALKNSLHTAYDNIRAFHEAQQLEPGVITTMPGVQCWQRSVGIEKVGLYIPGGTAPLFSTVLMLGVPAQLAGCREVIICSPATGSGRLHPALLYAASLVGASRIFRIGGAQAIGALAYGTATVPAVHKIFGPGNQYVTAAKQLVQTEGIAIDMPAGPSEVCVLADEGANPAFVASDLLSQAEHGADSQVLLVTTSATLVREVLEEVERQLAALPRRELAEGALKESKAILCQSMDEAVELVNAYAAEHLIIACRQADEMAARIRHAGSVFIGPWSPESAGDYASGTNHTLPTNGFARAYSGVNLDAFVRKITFQKLSFEGLRAIGETVMTLASAEGLEAHARAVSIRLEK